MPGPGHFRLLARWVSGIDPMAVAEGSNTLENTRSSNNIAWHNVDSVFGRPLQPVQRPFRPANPFPKETVTGLRIVKQDKGSPVTWS